MKNWQKRYGLTLPELFYREIDPETMRKNAETTVIENFGATFINFMKDFVAKKVKKINGEDSGGRGLTGS